MDIDIKGKLKVTSNSSGVVGAIVTCASADKPDQGSEGARQRKLTVGSDVELNAEGETGLAGGIVDLGEGCQIEQSDGTTIVTIPGRVPKATGGGSRQGIPISNKMIELIKLKMKDVSDLKNLCHELGCTEILTKLGQNYGKEHLGILTEAVLTVWREENFSNATRRVLVKALCKIGQSGWAKMLPAESFET